MVSIPLPRKANKSTRQRGLAYLQDGRYQRPAIEASKSVHLWYLPLPKALQLRIIRN